jgi:hypothetical protein
MQGRACAAALAGAVTLCMWETSFVYASQPAGFGKGTAAQSRSGVGPEVACSTPLRLYDGTSLTGTFVSISSRGLWINLSSVSFDNRTSSFKVGACSVDLASANGGGGALYEHCLTPGCEEDTMDPGWNNVISSVFLH